MVLFNEAHVVNASGGLDKLEEIISQVRLGTMQLGVLVPPYGSICNNPHSVVPTLPT